MSRQIQLDLLLAISVGIGLGYLSHYWRSEEGKQKKSKSSSSIAGRRSAASTLRSKPSQPPSQSPSQTQSNDLIDENEHQEILNLLYLIAEDQIKKIGYIHRGISCNACGITPIKGTRYHCTECVDVDLCENCEIAKRHNEYHILIKIKIPIPIVKSPRWIRKSWRPLECIHAKVNLLKEIPREPLLLIYTNYRFTIDELNALHDEFKQFVDIAIDTHSNNAKSLVPYGITLATFQKLTSPWNPKCLVATRLAYIYDRDHDGIITYEDFIGMRALRRDNYSERHAVDYSEKLMSLALEAFDFDNTGYTNIDNAIKLLNSYYLDTLETFVRTFEENQFDKQIHDGVLTSSRPLSTFFTATNINSITSGYTNKDESLAQVRSIIEELEKGGNLRYKGTFNGGFEGTDEMISPLLKVLYGRQASVDMMDAALDTIQNNVRDIWVWPINVRYGPRLMDIMSPIDITMCSRLYEWITVSGL